MTKGKSDVSEKELVARQELGAKLRAQERINQIEDLVRGIRASINILLEREKALLGERAVLRGEGNGK